MAQCGQCRQASPAITALADSGQLAELSAGPDRLYAAQAGLTGDGHITAPVHTFYICS